MAQVINQPTPQVRLVEPTNELEASHRSFVTEMRAADQTLIPWVLAVPADSFAAYVTELRDAARGIGIPEGKVAHATYWLVETVEPGRSEIVAVANIRYELNETLLRHGGHVGFGVRPSARRRGFATMILRLMLGELSKHGVTRVLVTCAQENTGSARAILRNGGELENSVFVPELGCVVMRYWIGQPPQSPV